MGTRTTDWTVDDEDEGGGDPIALGPALPTLILDDFADAQLLDDAADELAALLEVRRQFERYRDGLD